MKLAAILIPMLALGAAACGPSPEPPAPTPAREDPSAEAPLWSAEGLEAQPRMSWLRQRTPPELGFTPGTTDWRPAGPDAGQEAGVHAATPGAALLQAVGALRWGDTLGEDVWEQTLRVRVDGDDRAVGVVLRWGFKDDSVAGHDLRVRLRRRGGGWTAERVEERFHCARGVTADGLCV